MGSRHVPERTCLACRRQQPKRALVRIVRTVPGQVVVDSTGKLAGRGAYLCRQSECWTMGLRRDALGRALKTSVTPDDRAKLEAYAEQLTNLSSDLVAGTVAEGNDR